MLPVVLYSGDDGWTAAREIGELIEAVPGGLEKYRPQMRYLLVEELQVLETLIEWLQAPEQADLARALVVWLRRSLLASRMPDIDIPEIENLQEARTMLAERVKDWKKQWQDEAREEAQEDARKEGRKEGRKKGRKEGRKKGQVEGRKDGESAVLIKLLEHKFGTLDEEAQRRIADAGSDQLLNWAERILTADKIDEVFG